MKCQRCGLDCERTSGRQKYCPPCRKVKKKEWIKSCMIRHPDRFAARGRKFRLANPNKYKETDKRWRANNRDKVRAASRRSHARHREKVRIHNRIYLFGLYASRAFETEFGFLAPLPEVLQWYEKKRRQRKHTAMAKRMVTRLRAYLLQPSEKNRTALRSLQEEYAALRKRLNSCPA